MAKGWLTQRAGDGGDSPRFIGIFLASSLYFSQALIHTCPRSAANANR